MQFSLFCPDLQPGIVVKYLHVSIGRGEKFGSLGVWFDMYCTLGYLLLGTR